MRRMENILDVKVNATEKVCHYIHLHPSGGVEECSIVWTDPQQLRGEFHKIKNLTHFKKIWKDHKDHSYNVVMYCSKNNANGKLNNKHILPHGLKNEFYGSIYIFRERNEFPHDFCSWEYTEFFENSYG